MTIRSADSQTAHTIVPAPQASNLPPEVLEAARRMGVLGQLPQVVELTGELFGDSFEVHAEEDPEIANWTYLVFTVRVPGTVEDALRRNAAWCRRLPHDAREIPGAFCLSIDFQS